MSDVKALKLNNFSVLLPKPAMFASIKVIYKKLCHSEANEIAAISESLKQEVSDASTT